MVSEELWSVVSTTTGKPMGIVMMYVDNLFIIGKAEIVSRCLEETGSIWSSRAISRDRMWEKISCGQLGNLQKQDALSWDVNFV